MMLLRTLPGCWAGLWRWEFLSSTASLPASRTAAIHVLGPIVPAQRRLPSCKWRQHVLSQEASVVPFMVT